ncbi:MAG: discoidin domain-containing protein [Planctomycetes bacterium]|nr:discoidin domain-containing protein [Planctomycetota bacterium]
MLQKPILTAFCLFLLGPAAGTFAGDPTLIGWWKLNEGQGAVALDSSGNGNPGTIVRPNAGLGPGGSVWVNDPERGMVISFNGTATGAYVRAGSIPRMTLTNDFTWVFWAKQEAGNGANEIVFGNRMNESAADFVPRQFIKFTPTQFEWHQNSNGNDNLNYDDIPNDLWLHHVLVKTGSTITYYRNGVRALSRTITQALDFPMPLFFGGDNENSAGENWAGRMSDARVYARALTENEIRDAMAGKGPGEESASEPVPENRATDVPRDTILTWKPGEFAATHDVYLGLTFADVNAASRTDPKGVLASQGQAEATFDPPAVLAYGQTYYWRVDEVNRAPDNTIFKGDIWSFTVEPYGYPVKPAAATASSAQMNMGPEKTLDGSGLTGDLHGTEGTTMWLSSGALPNWIQYEFDQAYQLHDLKVWNSNGPIESFIGFGAKKVTIEYSTDGATWKAIENVPEFARGPGAPGYAANTTVPLGGVEAKFVKLTITATWGGLNVTGLAEVRFSYVPMQARAPQPANGAVDVSPDASLSWRPGRAAASHQVFFGTDQAAVANGTVAARTLTEHVYVPDVLTLGTTYYWRVDEVNTVTYPGDVWSFTTQSYQVVDDFESYTDQEGSRIYETWIDGWTNGTGSTVGYLEAPFAETTLIHGGKRSMPLAYDNTKAPVSEAVRTFKNPQDWTGNGIKSLSLWFLGAAGNSGQLYARINGTKVLYAGAATDLARVAWHVWNIDLSQAGQVNRVQTLTIGIEGSGAKGILYFDDICLYASLPGPITPADPGTLGLVAHYKLDGDARDSAGSHHGTLSGAPQPFTAGKVGQAFNVTGDFTYATVPYAADLALNTYTVAVWVNYTDTTGNRGILGTRFNGENTFDLKVDATRIHGDVGNGTIWLSTTADVVTAQGGAITTGVWHHILYAVEPGVTRIYLDGALASTVTYTGTPLFMKSGQELRIGCSYGSEFMRGMIDEVRLYNRALSAAEAAALAGRPGPVFQAP